MEADPEYATAEKAKASERAKRHYAQQKARWAEVKARAETDPEAAAELAEHLKKQSEATMASRRKLVEQAETDPEAAETLQARINHCIRDACGADISNDECQILFIDTVTELRKDYPEITVAMLDGIIWRKYQTSKQK